MFSNIRYGIRNLIRWIPTIWSLRDWDARYCYDLIHKQLLHVENYLNYNSYGVNAIKKSNRIKVARILTKRLIDDLYICNAETLIDQKYGELKFHFEKIDDSNFQTLVFDELEEESKARHKAHEHVEYMREQDKKMLFKYLNKYISEWWD